MYCSKCNKKVNDDATFCKYCGEKIDISNAKRNVNSLQDIMNNNDFKKYKRFIIISVVAVIILVYIFVFRCKDGFCLLPSSVNGDYCSIHTCNRSNCYNKVAEGKHYCYTHMPSKSSQYNYKPEVAEDVLSFSNISVTKNSSYTICTANITNNGKKTYTFIQVKGKFKNSSGTILDTDWTYAVGSEGLAPGESASFRLSVDKDTNITKCDLEILDYDKK